MEHPLQGQVETYLTLLNGLIDRGRGLAEALAANPAESSVIAATRAWQEELGVTINQLSGGSKAHWLARTFSRAFLMRSESGDAADQAALQEIVIRLIAVLEEAVASLRTGSNGSGEKPASALTEAPEPRRFEFVHNADLRPILEQAYVDSRRAVEERNFGQALQTTCGILEAIITDALEQYGLGALLASGAPAGRIGDWSFQTRVAVAEKARLIRGGCARLPAVGWTYRDQRQNGSASVSESEAIRAGQVLRVIMRDLDPGR
jgi:hypothetical protein